MNPDLLSPFIQHLQEPLIKSAGLNVAVYRLDLAHPDYSGNKYYKLKGLAQRMLEAKQNTVVSFGGRWSNHLLALSQYGQDHGLNTVAVVRDVATAGATPLLRQCETNGMTIKYVNAATYRERSSSVEQLLAALGLSGGVCVLPEGGSSHEAISGCGEIAAEITAAVGKCDHVVVPVGTGATMAGIVCRASSHCVVHGVAVTKKFAEQELLVRNAVADIRSPAHWTIERLPAFGAYGKLRPPLIEFIHRFEQDHGIPLDPNYTAKSFYWFYQALQHGKFCSGDSVVLLHTGGLMGRQGYPSVFPR